MPLHANEMDDCSPRAHTEVQHEGRSLEDQSLIRKSGLSALPLTSREGTRVEGLVDP